MKNIGLLFNDDKTRGHIFKLQKPMCNKSFRQQSSPVRCIGDLNRPRYQSMKWKVIQVRSFQTQLDRVWSGRLFDLDQIH